MAAYLSRILSLTDRYFVKVKLEKIIIFAIILFLSIPGKWDTTQQEFFKR